MAGMIAAALVAQIQVEGVRWQLIPLYLLSVGLAIGDILFVDRTLKWTNRVSRGLFGFLGMGLVFTLPTVLPVPALPVPSGGLSVGTFSVELIDGDRTAVYGPQPEGPRRIMVQVWYPAEVTDSQTRGLWSTDWDVVAQGMSRRLGLPGWFLNHTKHIRSNSVENAGVAMGTFPVVIYSHGWTGFRTIAVNQMESLASNGYIVLAIDHTYGAVATRFPNGDVVRYLPEALPPITAGRDAHMTAAQKLIETFADDIGSVMDALERGDRGPFAFVSATADLSRTGIYGHSTGGGAAVRFCLLDDRCDAVLGMDAWIEPLPTQVIRETMDKPALFMRSDGWRGTENDAMLRGLAGRGEALTYWIGVDGAGHNDFVATPLLSPIAAQMGFKGPISAGRIIPIIDNYLVGFFDVYLLGTGSAALETVRFREVTFEVIGR